MLPFVHLSIVFWLYMVLQCRSSMSPNSLVFHTSSTFLNTESSSSCVNYPSLMCSWSLIIFVIGSCVTFGGFLNRFSKCCFHWCILSSSLVAFSLPFTELFLLIPFTVCHAILGCLSSTEFLALLIWFCKYSVYSFRYRLHFCSKKAGQRCSRCILKPLSNMPQHNRAFEEADGFITFLRVWAICEILTALSKIWTQIGKSIF